MSDETSPAAGWGYKPIGTDNVPVHCGGLAYDEGDGDWVCAACDTPVKAWQIPGWTPCIQPAPTTPQAGTTARG